MEVIRSSDCGNSPKQKLLEDMSVTLAGVDAGLIDSLAVPQLVWLHVGGNSGPMTEVAIERVVSHGRAGAVNVRRSAICSSSTIRSALT
jgi:hypothetical protein